MTILGRYVRRAVARAFAATALALTGLFSLLDFVEQLASVGQGQYRVIDAFAYVALTAPARLLQVAAISMLLATLLALGGLARDAEYVAMTSLGRSDRDITRSMLWLILPISAALFVIAQFVIPPGQQAAQSLRTEALSSSMSFHAEDSLWAQDDLQYLNVRRFDPAGAPVGIDIYKFNDDGSLDSLVHADRATIEPDGTWLLNNVVRRRVHDLQIVPEHLPLLPWHSFLAPRQIRFLFLPVETMPPVALYGYIRGLERRHEKSPQYERAFWNMASLPVSMMAMILIGAPFASGPPRLQSTERNLALGVGFGLVFSMIQQIWSHAGLLLQLNAALTALIPPILVMVLAAYLTRRARVSA